MPRLDLRPEDIEDLSIDQARAIAAIATSAQLVQPLQAPAGAGKTHSAQSPARSRAPRHKQVLVCAPTGKAVDEALHEGAGRLRRPQQIRSPRPPLLDGHGRRRRTFEDPAR